MTYRIAPAVRAGLAQATKLWPGRNRAWDGTIGDASHQAHQSDHNPDYSDPQHDVDAFDLTHDPAHGCDCEKLWAKAVNDHRTKYVIWRRTITTGKHGTGPQPGVRRQYGGSNPHDHHMHVSILPGEAIEEDTSAWWEPTVSGIPGYAPAPPKEEDALAAVTREEFDALAKKVSDIWKAVGDVRGDDKVYRGGLEDVDLVKLQADVEAIKAKVGA